MAREGVFILALADAICFLFGGVRVCVHVRACVPLLFPFCAARTTRRDAWMIRIFLIKSSSTDPSYGQGALLPSSPVSETYFSAVLSVLCVCVCVSVRGSTRGRRAVAHPPFPFLSSSHRPCADDD